MAVKKNKLEIITGQAMPKEILKARNNPGKNSDTLDDALIEINKSIHINGENKGDKKPDMVMALIQVNIDGLIS